MAQYIFLLRHGDHQDGNFLTELGIQQFKHCAREMKALVGEDKTHYMTSSHKGRARRSLHIISQEFNYNTRPRADEIWFNGGESMPDPAALDALLEPHMENDVITVVSHLNIIDHYASHLADKYSITDYSVWEPKMGRGFVLDLNNKTCHPFPNDTE